MTGMFGRENHGGIFMRVSLNRDSIVVQHAIKASEQGLFNSMNRLSSGLRINSPGDAPADYGISETFRYQIRNSQAATRNLEKASNLINTSDAWMQTVQDIVGRMRELAIAAQDGSKTETDRLNLNTEYDQLKEEIARISRNARYNGLQVAGRDQMLSYDRDKETFVFSQFDGSEAYDLNVKALSGIKASNNVDWLFDSSKDYVQSYDGKYIYYVDSNDNLTRYDIEEGELKRDTADSETKALDVDDEGRLWYATETSTGSGVYSLRQQNSDSWVQDTTLVGNTDIADMANTEFSIYQDRIYYLNTSGDIVSRNIQSLNDVKVELTTTDVAFSTTAGQFAISEDGLFVADMPNATTIRVTNTETKLSNTYTVQSGVTVSSLSFGADNRDLAFVDSADGSIHHIEMIPGDRAELSNGQIIHVASGSTGFQGVSLDGGSHRANFRVHSGPDAGHETVLTMGDSRLHTLGLSRTAVDTIDNARHALEWLQEATNRISIQRARLGGEQSRMLQTYDAMLRYQDQISVADSVIRDVDVAEETAALADHQVRYQMTIALLAQSSQRDSNLLGLLNR